MAHKPIRNNLVLELHIPDFSKAKKFYETLGFKQIMYDPTSGGGSDLGYMVLAREDDAGRTLLNFYGDKPRVSQHAYFREFPKRTRRGCEVEITIPVADVDKLWNQIKTKLKSSVSQELTLKRWGKKDFRLKDPYGYYVRFTELVDWKQ